MYLSSAQIKGKIKNIAKQNHSDPITLLRIYMMERFLERIAFSKYRDCFIVKGGILVTSMIGISMRSTMDIDTTIRNFNLNEEKIYEIITEIKDIKLEDNIEFELLEISNIMDNMDYPGIRVHMNAHLEGLTVPIKIDISTGDVITPKAIEYHYPLLLENRTINLWSYNLETVLAEKLQTILSRSILNTRMRDFYDVTILYNHYKDSIDYNNLVRAFDKTCEKRNTKNLLLEYNVILANIATDATMHKLWKSYCKKYNYAKSIQFTDNIKILYKIIEQMNKIKIYQSS